MKEVDIDHIDRYIQGEMSPEEQTAFEIRLAENNELREIYEDVLAAGQISREMELNRVAELLRKEEKTNASTSVRSNQPWMRWAAVLIICVGTWVTFQYVQHKGRVNRVMAQFEHIPSNELTRGEGDVDVRRNAYVFYEARKYEEAVDYFEKILDQGQRKDSLFYAISLVGAHEFDEALEVLERLSDGERDKVRNELIDLLNKN